MSKVPQNGIAKLAELSRITTGFMVIITYYNYSWIDNYKITRRHNLVDNGDVASYSAFLVFPSFLLVKYFKIPSPKLRDPMLKFSSHFNLPFFYLWPRVISPGKSWLVPRGTVC